MQHFVYLWYDRVRKMFYVGSHSGDPNDGYISSSKWLNGEVRFRPQDFRRKIIQYYDTKQNALNAEINLLSLIEHADFGRRYYNIKTGKPKGSIPWNKGMVGQYSEERCNRISQSRIGRPTHNKGKSNHKSAQNGKAGAERQRANATGRKRFNLVDGSWTWAYQRDNGTWYYRVKATPTSKKWKEVDCSTSF